MVTLLTINRIVLPRCLQNVTNITAIVLYLFLGQPTLGGTKRADIAVLPDLNIMTMLRFYLIFLVGSAVAATPMVNAASADESRENRREEARGAAMQRQYQEGTGPQDNASSSGTGDSESENRSGRRNNRLSAEERRALRRQIDEAGSDIYRRRR